MSDISLHITVKEENGLLFKKCIRKLLESTFILQERDGKLYDFVSRESNWQDMSEYLRIIGFDLLVMIRRCSNADCQRGGYGNRWP